MLVIRFSVTLIIREVKKKKGGGLINHVILFGTAENYFQNSLPGIESPKEGNLRDEVLKPGYKTLVPKNFEDSIKDKVDVDLDGK